MRDRIQNRPEDFFIKADILLIQICYSVLEADSVAAGFQMRQEMDRNEGLGTIEQTDDGYVARLERYLSADGATLWSALTEPAKFVDWLAPGEIDLVTGGKAQLNFVDSGIVIDSEVTACEIPRLLEYSWSSPGEPNRPVRYEISDLGEERRLILTLTLPSDEDVARSCAGWEAHLMMLVASLEGVSIKFPFERFVETREAYNKMLEP